MATTPATPTTPRPTTYRPPAPAAKPKKSSGPMILTIALGVLALAGLGGAGFLFSQQGGLKAELATHRDAGLAAATTLNVAIDTNAPVDWAVLWPRINTTITTIRNESERQTLRLNEMEQELEVAQGLQANLQRAQADGQRASQQVTELTAQLEALKSSSAAQIAKLESTLTAERKAAEERLAAAPVAVDAAADTAVEGADAVVADAAAGGETDMAEGNADETEEPVISNHTFPARSELLDQAVYNSANQSLMIRLRDGTELNYTGIPRELFDQLIAVASPEPYYRIKIMGNFPVTPDDKAAVRAHNKRR
ncbi:MAG TPA: KTSC domain-containing protein [Kiritimatiellia bacterium]|nr:KTSC domain-containing protein [Kiritimatiellia bacterium]